MTRVEALVEEIEKLTEAEKAELREWLRRIETVAPPPPPHGRYTFADIRREIFPIPPAPRTIEEMRAGIEETIREKHGRR